MKSNLIADSRIAPSEDGSRLPMKTTSCTILLFALGVIAGCGGAYRPTPSASITPSAATPAPPSSSTSPPASTPPTTTAPPVVTPMNGTKLANIQASDGWNSWGQFAPTYVDCTAPCPGITWSMKQGVDTPSMSGKAARFDVGGTIPYSDVLWSNPVIGQFSTQGLSDRDHNLLPTLHNFIYDADFYVTNASVTQVLEFDVSMYMDGVGMIWGNQCNNLGGKQWDIWDNVNAKWVSTGVTCNLIDQGWNHITIEAQRGSDNSVIFQSFTLNGVTTNLNTIYAPFTVPAGWWGITVNYQMDGDYKQSANTTYLDNLSLVYW